MGGGGSITPGAGHVHRGVPFVVHLAHLLLPHGLIILVEVLEQTWQMHELSVDRSTFSGNLNHLEQTWPMNQLSVEIRWKFKPSRTNLANEPVISGNSVEI